MSKPSTRQEPAAETVARRLAFLVLPAGPFLLMLDQDVSEIWVVAVVTLFMVRSIWLWEFSWVWQPWMRFAYFFWVWVIIVSLRAQWLHEAMEYILPWMRFPVLAAAMLFWMGPSAQLRRRMLEAMIVGLSIIVVMLIIERLQNPDAIHLYGPFSRPRAGWYMLGVGLPIAMLVLDRVRDARHALWAVPCVALLFALTVATGEVYNSIIFGFGLVVYALARRMLSWQLLAAGAAALGLCVVVLASNDELFARFTTDVLTRLPWRPESDYHNPWTVGWEIARNNIWLGIGAENYQEHCDMLLAAGRLDHLDITHCFGHSHNLYLQVLAESGIPGLVLLVATVVALFWQVFRSYRWRAPSLHSAMAIAILVVVFWPISSYSNAFGQQKNHFNWFLIGCALTVARVADQRIAHREKRAS